MVYTALSAVSSPVRRMAIMNVYQNNFRDWKNACGEKRGRFPKHDSWATPLTSTHRTDQEK